jgi:hypothetical protein
MFSIGDQVVCIDASGLPMQFKPLNVGQTYIVRGIIEVGPGIMGHGIIQDSIHKNAKYCLHLFGIVNSTNQANIERGYADTRFVKIEDSEQFGIVSTKKETPIRKKVAA